MSDDSVLGQTSAKGLDKLEGVCMYFSGGPTLPIAAQTGPGTFVWLATEGSAAARALLSQM